jgi:hypothetical protein
MRLSQSVRKAVRQGNLIKAVALSVSHGLATVQLLGKGAIYYNLPIMGGVVSIGKVVQVDFSTGDPVVYSSYADLESAISDRTKPLEPIAHMNTYVVPTSGSDAGVPGEPGLVTYNWSFAPTLGGAIGDYADALGNTDAYYRLIPSAGPFGGSGGAINFLGISCSVAYLIGNPLYNTAYAIWGCPKDCASIKITPSGHVSRLTSAGRNLSFAFTCRGYAKDDTSKSTTKFYATSGQTYSYPTGAGAKIMIASQMIFSNVAAGDVFYIYCRASSTSRSDAGNGTLFGYYVELVDAA